MAQSIFLSWQSDSPSKVNHSFLKEILQEVCKRIAKDTTLDEAIRNLNVDSDTSGVAGQPPIVETIFRKIDTSSVFVGDLTFIGKSMDGKKLIPNPNVLIEYGWALKSLPSERVIYVMNTAYGEPGDSSHSNLPFNLRHLRWPITYHLPEDASTEKRKEEKEKLTRIIEKAIRASLATIPNTSESENKFEEANTKENPARFRGRHQALGIIEKPFFDSDTAKEIFLDDGPAIWLRVMPTIHQKRTFTAEELKEKIASFSKILTLGSGNGWSNFRAEDGVGQYESSSGGDTTNSVAFIFETGEIWAVDTMFLDNDRPILYLNISNALSKGLEKYSDFLNKLGINGPYKWKAGLFNIKGRKLKYPPPPGKNWISVNHGPFCLAHIIESEGIYNLGEDPQASLNTLFEKLFKKCGILQPNYLLNN